MYTPLAIANAIIAMEPGRHNAMWLNKAVYFVHGWSLAFGKSILGELPATWKYGPIYASLYDALRCHRVENIHVPQIGKGMDAAPLVPESDAFAHDVISQVVKAYGKFSPTAMSTLCHGDGSPWKEEAAAHDFRVPVDHVIPEWRLKNHFSEKLAAHKMSKAA